MAARLALLALAALAPAAMGCDGSSSARELASIDANGERTGADSDARQIAASKRSADSETGPSAKPDRVVDATFDDVKFAMEKTDEFDETMLTDQVRNLFGQRIRIRGYIYPTPRRQGLTQFVLVRDNLECCFGPGAALFDCIVVQMAEGETAEYTVRPVAVEGEFRFDPLPGPDGRPLAIYQMTGEAVR